jgi:hypothetical protein
LLLNISNLLLHAVIMRTAGAEAVVQRHRSPATPISSPGLVGPAPRASTSPIGPCIFLHIISVILVVVLVKSLALQENTTLATAI